MTTTTGTNIVAVDFGADTLWAIDRDGVVYVAITPICRTLGLNIAGQHQRIEHDPILAEGICVIHIPLASGGMQPMVSLPLELINGWLFGIDHRRVKPAAREAVLRYKRECHRVLYEHFFGRAERRLDCGKPPPSVDRRRLLSVLHPHTLRVYHAVCALGSPTANPEWGHTRTTVRQIAQHAGLSIESTYRHLAQLCLQDLLRWHSGGDPQLDDMMRRLGVTEARR